MPGPSARPSPNVQPRLRLDKWLHHARFFKTRDLAAEVIESGHLRLNGTHCLKPGHGVGVGDVLTFAQAGRIRLVRILALSDRRGPASLAQTLYSDLDPPPQGSSPLE